MEVLFVIQVTLSLILSTCWTMIGAFNVDTLHPLVYDYAGSNLQRTSYFGFSVALHENRAGKYLLVGAPRGNSSILKTRAKEPGAVFKCLITGQSQRCEELPFFDNTETSGITADNQFTDLWDNSWLGGSLDVAFEESPFVVTCAHLWKNQYFPDNYLASGMCFIIKSDLSRGSVKRLMPMTKRSKYVLDLFTYDYSMGLAGLSSHFVQDTSNLAIGTPGVVNWTGTVAHVAESEYPKALEKKKYNIPNPLDKTDNSYVGYSLSSGSFMSPGGKTEMVTGAPRFGSAGAVFIYDIPLPQDVYFERLVKIRLNGHQMGEYFGAAVCAVDLDNDQYADLLVGAPLNSVSVDEGKVYVYMNTKEKTLVPGREHLVGSGKPGSRFGTAITAVGDINQDGYQDVGIGAPYEDDRGAVYLYYGSKNGLKLAQKILAADVKSNLQGFGISISKSRDVDGNSVPDFAVGSYDSGHAVVLRSYPVIKVESTVEFSVPQIYMNAAKCLMRDAVTACFKVSVCTSYSGSSEALGVVDLTQTLTLGTSQHTDPRGFFVSGGDPASWVRYDIKLTRGKLSCKEFEAHILNSTRDFLTPVSFELKSELLQNPVLKPDFCSTCPVLNPDEPNTIASKLSFATNCGDDEVCHSELHVSAVASGLSGSSYIVGSSNTVSLKITVRNSGESAYLAVVSITFPNHVVPTRLLSGCQESAVGAERELVCDIGNPLPPNEEVTLEVPLDLTKVMADTTALVFNISATTSSVDRNVLDNVYILTLPIKTDADVTIIGSTEQIVLATNKTENATRNATTVYHTYQVVKYGSTPIQSLSVAIHVPEVFQGVSILESQTLEVFRSGNPTSHVPCEEWAPDTGDHTTLQGGDERTLDLDCETSECVRTVCNLGSIREQEVTTIKISMEVFLDALLNAIGDKDQIRFASLGTLTINDQYVKQPANNKPDFAEAVTDFYKDGRPASKEIASWIIPVCIVVGILLLLLIVFVFYKMGFFRRAEKEKMEKLSHEEGQDNLLEIESTERPKEEVLA